MFNALTQSIQLRSAAVPPLQHISIQTEAPAVVPAVPIKADLAPTQETLRRVAWELGEKKPAASFNPSENHVGLNYVAPRHGFVHWRILPEWIERVAREKGEAWRDCRMVVRLYDVSLIIFNGLNAHSIIDLRLPQIAGHLFFHLPKPGTTQLAEAGFV